MRERNYKIRAIVMCIASVLLAKVGFANLVNIFFPIFGYLGILQIVLIVITAIKGNNKRGDNNVKE
jgi:uncharacterized membrane protein YkvI